MAKRRLRVKIVVHFDSVLCLLVPLRVGSHLLEGISLSSHNAGFGQGVKKGFWAA
jgi:hypothetical protein